VVKNDVMIDLLVLDSGKPCATGIVFAGSAHPQDCHCEKRV